MIQILLSKAIF